VAPADPPTTQRPRRRTRASDLFERVVPEDPPTMRLSRIKPTTIEAKNLRAKPPAADEDATVQLGEDATVELGEDATLPLGEDATRELGEDATLPMDDRH
jgi:hypothetical protein